MKTNKDLRLRIFLFKTFPYSLPDCFMSPAADSAKSDYPYNMHVHDQAVQARTLP